MRIRLLVSAPGGRCDVLVDAPPGTEVAGLRRAVAGATGTAVDLPWWTERRLLPDSALLGGPGLRDGDEVSLGEPAATELVEPSPLHLAVVGGPGAGTVVPLGRGVHLLGRGEVCDLRIPDVEVSRRHAAVTVTTAGVGVRDLDSRNGTTRSGEVVDRDGGDLAPGDSLRLGHSTVVLRSDVEAPFAVRPTADGRVLVLRPAHDRPHHVDRTLTAPAATPDRGRPRIAWIGALVPAVAGVGLAWFLHTWQFLAFAALTPLTVLGTAAGDRWSWRASRRRAAADHALATARFERRRTDLLARERATRLAVHPDAPRCLQAAQGPSAPLWQRRPGDGHVFHVRLGTGSRPSRTGVVADDGRTRPAGRLADLPVCADLQRGPLGIAGPERHARAVARAAVAQLAVAHPPGALEFVVLRSDDGDDSWDWLRWLPHRVRHAVGPDEVGVVLAGLVDRVSAVDRSGGRDGHPGPWTVLVADRAGALADHAALDEVLAGGVGAGVLAVCVDRAAAALPGTCAAVAVAAGSTHALLATGGTGWDTDDGAPDTDGPVVSDQVSTAWCTRLARALAPLDDGARDGALPRRARLRDLLGDVTPETVIERWARDPGSTAPLRATVGVDPTGPATLDLTTDGPHALVAGTTGSGKSELLQSWVASLAVAHPPDDVGFLLVDYKGGAAFGACARLPHTLGLVTDLDHHLTARVLRSLDAEIRRRERLFAAAGATDLATHRRAGGPEDVARLIVVVDEFATLAADLPEFVPGLVDIAQRGRSLGVHLVLATQRPGHAVSPAIRANTTLRIALRVTEPGESSDVVGTADAAGIPPTSPGRAVVRTGTGLTSLQTAQVSTPVGQAADAVRAWRVQPWQEPVPDGVDGRSRTDLDDLVEVLDKAWARRFADGASAPRPTWLPALPDDLTAADVAARVRQGDGPDDPDDVLRPTIGLRDQPDHQRQVPDRLDLAAGGSLLVSGAARSGRTQLLLTVAHACAAAGVPTVTVHSGGLAAPAGAPTTVADVASGDADTLTRLLDRLEHEYSARRDPNCPLPRPPLVVLVDGWTTVATALDDLDGGRSTERFLGLWRGAGSVGVTVVVTGDRGVLATRTASAADRVLLFRLADPADAAMAGVAARDLPEVMPPGRGVWAPDGDVVQVVRPGPTEATAGPRPTVTGLRLRALPDRAVLGPDAHAASDTSRLHLGLGGDDAGVVAADPWVGAGRWLVAGPPRSGRSTTLTHLATEAARGGAQIRWWARPHSPLATAAGAHRWPPLRADATTLGWAGTGRCLVVLDDVDDLSDAPVTETVARALRETAPGVLAVVCSGRADELLMSYRGVVAEVRRARRGLLLRPGPGDGDLVGVRTGRTRAGAPPGRGVLVADGVTVDGRPVEIGPLPLQVSAPADPVGRRRAA